MDSSLSSGDVARALGVSIPRIHRAVAAGLVPCRREANRRLRFEGDVLRVLRRHWGWCPAIPGLNRSETLILGTLARRPLGLRSARAVGRVAGLSPTAAARALRSLRELGYVEQRTARVPEGRARDVRIWTIRWGSSQWLSVASAAGKCLLPARPAGSVERGVPRRLAHLFWNVDVGALDPPRDARYIADRVLRQDDTQALAWMTTAIPRSAIAAATRGRGLDRRRAALGRALAAPHP